MTNQEKLILTIFFSFLAVIISLTVITQQVSCGS